MALIVRRVDHEDDDYSAAEERDTPQAVVADAGRHTQPRERASAHGVKTICDRGNGRRGKKMAPTRYTRFARYAADAR